MKPSQKADLYPNVRNHYSKDAPVIESNGAVLVNPNTFGRLKAVFNYIIDKSGMTGSYSHSNEIGEDEKVHVLPQKQSNVRSAITVTCDGLPHLLAISVIENCFICKKCGIKIESLSSVTAHKNNFNHNTFYKQYGDIILRIGNFHLELTMHWAFVSLNWPIIYSEIAKFVNFKSPKAQLVIQKVADLHKSTDIFMAQRTVKIREILVPFIKHSHKEGIHPSAHYFEEFIDKEVKDPNYKLAVKIEQIYGTCLCIMDAAIHANNPKLIKAAKNVFSGLFHIRGNNNYSIIELFDTYLMDSCRKKASDLFSNLESNEGTNLTNEPFCAQANDARHEILNKVDQNLGSTLFYRKTFYRKTFF